MVYWEKDMFAIGMNLELKIALAVIAATALLASVLASRRFDYRGLMLAANCRRTSYAA